MDYRNVCLGKLHLWFLKLNNKNKIDWVFWRNFLKMFLVLVYFVWFLLSFFFACRFIFLRLCKKKNYRVKRGGGGNKGIGNPFPSLNYLNFLGNIPLHWFTNIYQDSVSFSLSRQLWWQLHVMRCELFTFTCCGTCNWPCCNSTNSKLYQFRR